jgi:hypothetical protein
MVQVFKVLTADDIAAGEVELDVLVTAIPMAHGLRRLNQTAQAVLSLRPVPSYGLVVTIDQFRTGLPSRPGELTHFLSTATHCFGRSASAPADRASAPADRASAPANSLVTKMVTYCRAQLAGIVENMQGSVRE